MGAVDADSIDDPIPPVENILKRCDHSSLLMTYNIPSFPDSNVMVFLAMVAKSYGRVLKGGIPDKVAAARTVLRDWNCGKIPYYSTPPEDDVMAAADVHSKKTAVIVSQMSKELNLEKWDEEVMNALKDKDALDFVQLKGDTRSSSSMHVDAVKFLTGDDNNDDDSNDDMDVEDAKTSRANLKDADDYDFDAM